MSVEVLRKKLADLEAEGRFGGRAYPEGLEPFPHVLPGQGFFPGGDGLWRDPQPEALRRASPYAFPVGGIMFLGNDFGSLAGFGRLKLHENPPTWRHMRERIDSAGLPGSLGFYTNAYLGLRSDRSALADPIDHPGYRALCAEYLAFQIRTQMPRLIVVFGDRATGLLSPLTGASVLRIGQADSARFEGKSVWVLAVSHPYSDLSKSADQRAEEGRRLAAAWLNAQKSDPA